MDKHSTIQEFCKIHKNKQIIYLKIDHQKACLIPMCSTCVFLNRSLDNLLEIEDILSNQKTILNWPPLKNPQMLNDVLEEIKIRDIESSISEIQEQINIMREQMSQRIHLLEKSLIQRMSENHDIILNTYSKISQCQSLCTLVASYSGNLNQISSSQDIKSMLESLFEKQEQNEEELQKIFENSKTNSIVKEQIRGFSQKMNEFFDLFSITNNNPEKTQNIENQGKKGGEFQITPSIQESIDKNEEKIKELNDKNAELEKENAELKVEKTKLKEEKTELQKEKTELKNEKKNLEEQVEQYIKQVNILNVNNENLVSLSNKSKYYLNDHLLYVRLYRGLNWACDEQKCEQCTNKSFQSGFCSLRCDDSDYDCCLSCALEIGFSIQPQDQQDNSSEDSGEINDSELELKNLQVNYKNLTLLMKDYLYDLDSHECYLTFKRESKTMTWKCDVMNDECTNQEFTKVYDGFVCEECGYDCCLPCARKNGIKHKQELNNRNSELEQEKNELPEHQQDSSSEDSDGFRRVRPNQKQ
ncbi:hypothetical protein TTHERM_01117310 (macronuclear) [Tetrahymena thermophila SB210]|uniref:Uncharacterized protein n=1 Tax=Tetrahymena thermophila (strain SB210) TaxID=312017 RepID=Q240M7_TETTS|nr:hypothetical protein TTHERM_01117310 [Tetrahymena thermophila SB210]EAS02238.2 hypothetical protein TTHERM_01117310 [Tetrahymena thermophila SB210]|eukprot:XP_001022483.2 hypothetical protein TTHERM_01117310 [Tetrahymena thermophila SB210]